MFGTIVLRYAAGILCFICSTQFGFAAPARAATYNLIHGFQGGRPNIYEFKDPIHEQVPDREFTRPVPVFSWPIVFDAGQNRLYFREGINFFDPWDEGEYGATDPDFLPLAPRGLVIPFVFQSHDCFDGGSSGTAEYGLAVDSHYLMFSCNEIPGGVFVYRNASGRHRRIERLNAYAIGLALGP